MDWMKWRGTPVIFLALFILLSSYSPLIFRALDNWWQRLKEKHEENYEYLDNNNDTIVVDTGKN